MGFRAGVLAGQGYVELGLNDRKFVDGLRRAAWRMRNFGETTKKIGRGLTTLGLSAGIAAGVGINSFVQYEQQMAKVRTMITDTAFDTKALGDEVLSLSMKYGEGTETVTNGLYDILSAMIPVREASGTLEIAMRGAVAGMTDTKTSANALTNILLAYNISAKESGRVMDVLFKIVQRGKLEFRDISQHIGNVTTIANAAGVSLHELGATFAFMTRKGLSAEHAVTSIRAILNGFLKPSGAAVKHLQEMAKAGRSVGFELSAASIKALSFREILNEIGQMDIQDVSLLFPESRSIKGLSGLLGNMDAWNEDLLAMQNSTGALDDAFKKMSETVWFSINRVKAALTGLAVDVFRELQADLRDLVKSFVVGLKYVRGWVKGNKDLALNILKVIGALLVAGPLFIAVGIAIHTAAATMVLFAATLSVIATVGSAVLGTLGLITTAALAVGVALTTASITVLPTLIAGVATGIALLSGAFWALATVVGQALAGVGGFFAPIALKIISSLPVIFTAVKAFVIANAVLLFAAVAIGLLPVIISGLRIITTTITAELKAVVNTVIKSTESAIGAFVDGIARVKLAFETGGFQSAFKGIWEAAEIIWMTIANEVRKTIADLKLAVQNIVRSVKISLLMTPEDNTNDLNANTDAVLAYMAEQKRIKSLQVASDKRIEGDRVTKELADAKAGLENAFGNFMERVNAGQGEGREKNVNPNAAAGAADEIAKSLIDVAGTTNSNLVNRIGASNTIQKRMADAIDQVADNTENTIKAIRDGYIQFA